VTTQDQDESDAPRGPEVQEGQEGDEKPPAASESGSGSGSASGSGSGPEPEGARPSRVKAPGGAADEEPDEDAVRETPRWREFEPPGGNGPLFDPEGLLFEEPAREGVSGA